MKYIIDGTNNRKIKLSTTKYIRARDLINRGKVKDTLGDTLAATEVTDVDGDLIVDDNMYEEICTALGINPRKL